jgi:hypothetical protein
LSIAETPLCPEVADLIKVRNVISFWFQPGIQDLHRASLSAEDFLALEAYD